ncbi:hypothetical protein [Candidatus Poriferisodalis sp.]|uniref:hypothetical protein n=1 Tax=Candidatus Poriferisodalis sp. TaxID=3101277 RepID=UPI003D0C874C
MAVWGLSGLRDGLDINAAATFSQRRACAPGEPRAAAGERDPAAGGDSFRVRGSTVGSRFTSIRYGERLDETGATPSVGSVGDSYDCEKTGGVAGVNHSENQKQVRVLRGGRLW